MATKLSTFRRTAPLPALVEQRTAPRHAVTVTHATVRQHGDRPADAALHDLSPFGCRIATRLPLAAGDRLWLRFDGSMPIAAAVVWSDDGLAGCRFDARLTQYKQFL